MTTAIIGFGSIGKRHATNLKYLGYDVIIIEPDKSNDIYHNQAHYGFKVYESLEACAEKEAIETAFVCTPTHLHIPVAQSVALLDGINGIFIEKPLSHNMDGIGTLLSMCQEKHIRLGSACNLLYLSGINVLKNYLFVKSIGQVYRAQYSFGHDLRKWNDRDYTKTYSAGEHGGILLDDSHGLYLIENLFGDIVEYSGHLHKTGLLDIANEDTYVLSGKTKDNILVTLHGDYLSPEYIRHLEVYGTEGYLQYEMIKKDADEIGESMMVQNIYIKNQKIDEVRTLNNSEPLNSMYLREVEDFMKFVSGVYSTFHDGVSEMRVILEIKKRYGLRR